MEGIFFSANVSNKCFLREVRGKQQSGKRRLLTEITIQSSVVAVK